MHKQLLLWAIGVVLGSGCTYGVREQTDQMVCDMAAHVRDLEPPAAKDQTPPMLPADSGNPHQSLWEHESVGVQPAGFQQAEQPVVPKQTPLEIPRDLPG